MPAPLSLSRATITTPDEVLDRVSLIVRVGVATVRRGRELLLQRSVVSVVSTSQYEWAITLDDGALWSVKRQKGG